MGSATWETGESRSGAVERSVPYPSVGLVLLHFALRLDHKERVVEQEDHQIAAVSLPTSTLLEGALVDELAPLLLEAEVLQRGARR